MTCKIQANLFHLTFNFYPLFTLMCCLEEGEEFTVLVICNHLGSNLFSSSLKLFQLATSIEIKHTSCLQSIASLGGQTLMTAFEESISSRDKNAGWTLVVLSTKLELRGKAPEEKL